MPRKQRFYVGGVPAHVVQRGNNRGPVFLNPKDYSAYLMWLEEACRDHGCQLHAYVLMTNHVHLLLTPMGAESISRMVQQLGRKYVPYINKRYERTGTLWEGRHKGSIIDSSSYALHCYRYIEQNPVRAGMVTSPGAYEWSSYRWHASGQGRGLVGLPEYTALGETDLQRRAAYRTLLENMANKRDVERIGRCVQTGTPLGSTRFRKKIERLLDRKVGQHRPGRPPKHPGRDE